MKIADHAVARGGKAHLAYYANGRSFTACRDYHFKWTVLWDDTTDVAALIDGPNGCSHCRDGLATGAITLKP